MTGQAIMAFLDRGGPAMWVIAALSVATLAIILWKLWQLARLGAWRGGPAERVLAALPEGVAAAQGPLRGDLRSRVLRAALESADDPTLTEAAAREETTRVARAALGEARVGLRALELISTVAPLVGLLGTVLGMIEAFQALQEAGNRADPAALAGGIWQALLTTAAGMAVAIPASVALSWFEGVAERVQADMEDAAVRVFVRLRGRP